MFDLAEFRQFCSRFCSTLTSMAVFSLLVLYLIAGSTWLEIVTTICVAIMMLGLAGLMRLRTLILDDRDTGLQPIPAIAGFNQRSRIDPGDVDPGDVDPGDAVTPRALANAGLAGDVWSVSTDG